MTTRALLIVLFFHIHAAAQPVQDTKLQISPVIPIILKSPIAPPAAAQAKDNLLWYKGKKIDDSTLITPQATLVRWSKTGDIVIVQPKKDPFIKSVNELTKNVQRKDQFYNKITEHQGSVVLYPVITGTLKEFDRISENYSDILKNTIELPPAVTAAVIQKSNVFTASYASYPVFNSAAIIPEYIKIAYTDVMASVKNYPPIDFPAPPSSEFGKCITAVCDSNAQKDQESKEVEWQRSFTKYEAGIIQKSVSIMKKIHEVKLENDPEATPILAGLHKAIEFAFARATNKVDLLIRKYGNDFTRLSSVVRAALSIERQKHLMGIGEDKYAATVTKLVSLFDGFEKYIQEQMDARNYDVVFNLAFIIGLERQRQLLGAEENPDILNYIDRLSAFNRFRLDVQIDYKAEWPGCGVERANFTATNFEPGYLMLGFWAQKCRYNFFLHESYIAKSETAYHFGDPYNFELKVTNGTGTEDKYSEDGEKCWQVSHDLNGLTIRPYEPIASISFCENNDTDSLEFYNLHLPVSHENREDIRYNYAKFDHFNTRMRNDGFDNSYPSELEILEPELEQLKTEQGMYEMNPYSKPALLQMQKHFLNASRAKEILKIRNELEERSNPSVILFDAKNGAKVIIDEKTTKTYRGTNANLEPETADITIRVKITHDPLPYKKTEVKKD